jgi:hypothetical protein
MNLWLDDVRDPVEYGHINYVWVKTAEEAIELLKKEKIKIASLDHDLGTEKTGYNVVCWMEENNVWPEKTFVHSQNPVGKQKMLVAINRHYGESFQ